MKYWHRLTKVALMLSCLLLIISGAARASELVQSAGDLLAVALPAVAGGVTLQQRDYPGLFQLAESGALAVGSTLALKYTVDERRPNGDRYSFPSGHSAVAFAAAEFLHQRYGWSYGLPAYGAAAFVGLSRVESRQHYVHDVLAGAAIGIGSSYLFTEPYQGVAVRAELDRGYYGIRLSRVW